MRRRDVPGVTHRRVAGRLRVDVRSTTPGMLGILQDKDPCPVGENEPVTVGVERPRCALRRVVEMRAQRADPGETGDREGMHRRIASAGNDHVGLLQQDCARSTCDCLRIGCACARRGKVRPSEAMGNRDLSAREVREQRSDEIRGQRALSLAGEIHRPLGERGESPDPRANDDCRVLLGSRLLRGIVSVREGLVCGLSRVELHIVAMFAGQVGPQETVDVCVAAHAANLLCKKLPLLHECAGEGLLKGSPL
jgi:hypothetical protein